MKNLRAILAILCVASLALLAGCQSGEPQLTNQDQKNLDRLHKEGIGKVMADDAKKNGVKGDVSLANPTGAPGPEAHKP
ncbi:MAG: hypothetical protein ACO1SV_19655 [Fimbriimonas sp.]